jgi:hypothetical protein
VVGEVFVKGTNLVAPVFVSSGSDMQTDTWLYQPPRCGTSRFAAVRLLDSGALGEEGSGGLMIEPMIQLRITIR